jgi:hypothetical protein
MFVKRAELKSLDLTRMTGDQMRKVADAIQERIDELQAKQIAGRVVVTKAETAKSTAG